MKETSLFNENREEDLELLSYRIGLQSQIYYNRKAEYLSLIKEYLKENAGKDGASLFRLQFLHIYRKDNKALKTLEEEILEKGLQVFSTFLLDSKSESFSKLIEQIVSDCDFLTFNPEETYGFNEDQFRDSIEKIFFQMRYQF